MSMRSLHPHREDSIRSLSALGDSYNGRPVDIDRRSQSEMGYHADLDYMGTVGLYKRPSQTNLLASIHQTREYSLKAQQHVHRFNRNINIFPNSGDKSSFQRSRQGASMPTTKLPDVFTKLSSAVDSIIPMSSSAQPKPNNENNEAQATEENQNSPSRDASIGEGDADPAPSAPIARAPSSEKRKSGFGAAGLLLLHRTPSLTGRKGRDNHLHHGTVQGKEFVQTLARREKPAYVINKPVIQNPFKRYNAEQIDEFCAMVMGSQGRDRLGSCRSALEKDPSDRSLADLEVLMDFTRRSPYLQNECTPVERFCMMRCSRLMWVRAEEPADLQKNAVIGSDSTGESGKFFIVMAGNILGKVNGQEEHYIPGNCFGSVDAIMQCRSNHVSPDPRFSPEECVATMSTQIMYFEDWEYNRTFNSYKKTVAQGQACDSFVPTFLASLDLFRNWAWYEVKEIMSELEGVQVDKGITMFREGDVVDGIHILHFGECQVERSNVQQTGASSQYGLKVSINTDADVSARFQVQRPSANRRAARSLGVCGPRSIFGEDLADTSANLVKRRYSLKTLTDCWFIFISRNTLKNIMQSKHKSERQPKMMQVLAEIAQNREGWVQTRFEKEQNLEDASVTRLPILRNVLNPRWSI